MPAQIIILLSDQERIELEKVVSSRMTPMRLVERAKDIWMAADNTPSYKIAKHLGVGINTIGRCGTMTHDYKRHGTSTLFAALNTATGEVIGECKKRHRHEEFLSFLKTVKKQTSSKLDIHIIVDNYATHKHENEKVYFRCIINFDRTVYDESCSDQSSGANSD